MVAPPPKMAPTLWIHQKKQTKVVWGEDHESYLGGEVAGCCGDISGKSGKSWGFLKLSHAGSPVTMVVSMVSMNLDDLRLPHDLLETSSRNWWNLGPFRNRHFCGPSYEAAITKGDTMRYPSDGIRIGIMVNDGEICGKLPTEYVRSHTHLAYWLSQPFLIPIILQATSPKKKHHMESLTLW